MQRIRAGLTGLACVFLIVVLAAAFLNMARTDDGQGNMVVLANGTVTNTAAVDETPRDPLAELGVAPDAAVTEPAPPATTAPPPPAKR